MTFGDALALWGAGIEVLSLPEPDCRDRRLLAMRRGKLAAAIPSCMSCQSVQRSGSQRATAPQWASAATSAILAPPRAPIDWMERCGLHLRRTSWIPTLCVFHRVEALDCVGVDWLLLFGPAWANAWRDDLGREMEGRIGVWSGRWWVMPVWDKESSRGAVRRWAQLVNGQRPTADCLPSVCVKCGSGVAHYDSDGVAWCVFHWQKNRN